MIEKPFGGDGEIREQSVCMFALIVIELCHCSDIQELVEELAAAFPHVSVLDDRDIP